MADQPSPAEPDFDPPDATYVRQRFIPAQTVEWVHAADAILVEHGAVRGRKFYVRRHHARWRAERLIRLMVELRLHERWELKQHVERRPQGYTWTVEYFGGQHGRDTAAADR